MISLPDFKEKQLLFIRAERGVFNKIKFQNDNLVFLKDDKVINRASCHKVFGAFVIGDITITSGLMRDGVKHGVSFFFLKDNLETYASIGATAEGHFLLRGRQYAWNEETEMTMARHLIANKVTNQCNLLKERKKTDGLCVDLDTTLLAIQEAGTSETLLGLEGNASRRFFEEYYSDIGWVRRAPRTKGDIHNILLDIGYSMLFNCVDALLRLHGFDTYKGFHHKLFFQRKSLACDIMEPFRCVIDRQFLKSWNLKQIDPSDFTREKGRYVLSYEHSRKYAELFMQTIMDNKEDLYNYVHGFYRYVMNEGSTDFPLFKM